VTRGEDDEVRLVGESGGDVCAVRQRVEHVERQPANAEDGTDPAEELDGTLQTHDVPFPALVVAPEHRVAAIGGAS